METYLTLEKEANGKTEKRSFYVYADGRAKEGCHEIADFGELYIFLAGAGWHVAKETNITTPSAKPQETRLASPVSKKRSFARQWASYLFGENACNVEC